MASNTSLAGVLLIIALVACSVPTATSTMAETRMSANPIRKVVNMLQAMQKKVQEDGEEAEKLFQKYMCYCKNSRGDLAASIADAAKKNKELPSAIDAAKGQKTQLEEDLSKSKRDQARAKKTIADDTEVRKKEEELHAKDDAELALNIDGLNKAIASIQQGGGNTFLQTQQASVVHAYVEHLVEITESDRTLALSFLAGKLDSDAMGSGEIVGILEQMEHTLAQQKVQGERDEADAVASWEKRMVNVKKELVVMTQQYEKKLEQSASSSIDLAELKNDLEDSRNRFEEDSAFLADLQKNCGTRDEEHEKDKKLRAEELVALSDTIKMLNDDDALELFKKTLPSSSSSFLQLETTTASMRSQARDIVQQARSKVQPGHGAVHLDFIALALTGKKLGLDKVVDMIQKLIKTLKQEQEDDDSKKEYCTQELDTAEDKEKTLQRTVHDLVTSIEETDDAKSTLQDEIDTLKKNIVKLDQAVAEATQQRKEENTKFKDLIANNGAAKSLIVMAKNRLSKVYASALVQQTSDGAPPTPSPYQKSGAAGGGVISMLMQLIGEIDTEIAGAKTEEKIAQEAYQHLMEDSAEKRTIDSKSIDDKESSVSDLESESESVGSEKKSAKKELSATSQNLHDLHLDCDWMMKYYPTRKTARSDELDSLSKAIVVLRGFVDDSASSALIQLGSSHARARKFLPRHAA